MNDYSSLDGDESINTGGRMNELEDRHPGLSIKFNPEHDNFTLTHKDTDTQTTCEEVNLEDNAKWLVGHAATATKFDGLNTDIIDIEGLGTVDISKLSFVGVNVSAVTDELFYFEIIVDSRSLWVTGNQDDHTRLLTAMRGRP